MKILVCGDAMLDIYYRGHVSRLAPEAPVPVLSVSEVEQRNGGAANVADTIEAMGVPCERLFSGPRRIEKIRLLHGSHIVARVDFDYPQEPIRPDAAFKDAITRCDMVVFIDYGKGTLSDIASLIQYAREAKRMILIDPKGHDWQRYRGANLIKPNKTEMKELIGGWSSQEELDFKARQFLLISAIDSILLTQASEGMTLYSRTATIHEEAIAQTPLSPTGAGEATIAAYAAAISKGHGPAEALKLASRAAAIACSRFGVTVVKGQEIGLDGLG